MRTSRRDSDRSAAEPFARKLSSIVRRSSAFLHGDDLSLHQWSDNQSHEVVGASKSFGLHYLRRFSRATTSTAMTIDEFEPSLGLDDLVDPERQRRRTLEAMSFHVLHTAFAPPRVIERAPSSDSDSGDDLDADEDEDDVGAATWVADDNQNNGELWMVGVDRGNAASEQSQQQHVDDGGDEECKAAADDAKAMEIDESLRRLSRVPTDGLDDNEDSKETFAALLRSDGGREIRADEDTEHVDEELRFDEVNLTASVRKLVRRIEQASTEDLLANSAVSNQDEDAAESHESHVELLPLGSLESQPSSLEQQDHLKLPELPSGAFLSAHDSSLLAQSCYIPMDDVQDELTSSMRRLVIGLKKDSEATTDDSSGLGARLSSRRRGNSCPASYRPTARSSAADSTVSTAASVSMEIGTAVDPPARQRKRSAFARLAPKLLEPFRRKRRSYLFTDEELESVEGARWKIVELAFRFGGKHRFYLVQAVNMFFPLVKYGRRGGPHPTRLHCNRCGTIQWQHKRGGLSEAVDLADVLKVLEGRQTAVFRKYASSPEQEVSSLSLIFKERTLDLETQSASHRDWLMSALRTLVTYARKQRQLEQRAIAERGLLPVDELSGSGSSVGHPMPATVLSPHHSSPRMLW
ncbi:hypothetical protein PINS_up000503 [Pythium insidiosum]|nr:hypothetical protein PINS_up000503 [Pythium insidiosum]